MQRESTEWVPPVLEGQRSKEKAGLKYVHDRCQVHAIVNNSHMSFPETVTLPIENKVFSVILRSTQDFACGSSASPQGDTLRSRPQNGSTPSTFFQAQAMVLRFRK